MLRSSVASLIASYLSQVNLNVLRLNLVSSVLAPDMKHEYRCDK